MIRDVIFAFYVTMTFILTLDAKIFALSIEGNMKQVGSLYAK